MAAVRRAADPCNRAMPNKFGRGVRGAAALVGVGTLLLAAGCSSPSYQTLRKIARSVPVPSGVTFVREEDFVNRANFGGADQKQVAVDYSNPTMSCAQLTAAWRDALQEAHIDVEPNSGDGPAALYLKIDGVQVVVDPGGSTGSCPNPRVSVGNTA